MITISKIEDYIKNLISFTWACKTILLICSCVVIFHILIMSKIIPYDIVWWGRLTNDAEMYRFESISLMLNVFIVILVATKWWFIKYFLPAKVVSLMLRWLFFILIGNTIANVFSESLFEAIFFTILTWLLALLIYRIQMD